MKTLLLILVTSALTLSVRAAEESAPTRVIAGLNGPGALAAGFGGHICVAVKEPNDKNGTAGLQFIEKGNAVTFANALSATNKN